MSDDSATAALPGRRAIVFGADTDFGRALAVGLRDAGASVGLTSSATEGQALFALKRAAAGGPAEAADLVNPTSVRVATKKLYKALGGLECAALVRDAAALERDSAAATEPLRIAAKEIGRSTAKRIAKQNNGDDARGRALLIVTGLTDQAASEALAQRAGLPALLDSLQGGAGALLAGALLAEQSANIDALVGQALAWLAGREAAGAAAALLVEARATAAGGAR